MFNFNDKVESISTGYKGVVIARIEFLHGCTRYRIQPRAKKDGSLPEAYDFDEPDLKLIQASPKKKKKTSTGGDRPMMKRPTM